MRTWHLRKTEMAIYKDLKLIYARYFSFDRHITRARKLPDFETLAQIKFNCCNKISHIGCIYVRECPNEFNCSKLVSSF